ncbi:MAG: response regulator transcription factor [Chitinophagales bacterium]
MNHSMVKILVVDDEKDILEFVGYSLRKEKFSVFTAKNGQQAIDKAKEIRPHLIILDIMMPILDGIQACQELRMSKEFDQTMICFLSAMSEEFTHVMALDAGADDFITKPIRPRLLVSKVKSLVRRVVPMDNPNHITAADLTIDLDSFQIKQKNKSLDFVRKEFLLLHLLASKPGRVFTRSEILKNVWGSEVIVNDRTIDVHIRKVREKLGDGYIKTIKGVGYKFEA